MHWSTSTGLDRGQVGQHVDLGEPLDAERVEDSEARIGFVRHSRAERYQCWPAWQRWRPATGRGRPDAAAWARHPARGVVTAPRFVNALPPALAARSPADLPSGPRNVDPSSKSGTTTGRGRGTTRDDAHPTRAAEAGERDGRCGRAGLGLRTGPGPAGQPAAADRPERTETIVVIIADDMRFDFRTVLTHLDASWIDCVNAAIEVPMCGPSRRRSSRGMYSSRTGVNGELLHLPDERHGHHRHPHQGQGLPDGPVRQVPERLPVDEGRASYVPPGWDVLERGRLAPPGSRAAWGTTDYVFDVAVQPGPGHAADHADVPLGRPRPIPTCPPTRRPATPARPLDAAAHPAVVQRGRRERQAAPSQQLPSR